MGDNISKTSLQKHQGTGDISLRMRAFLDSMGLTPATVAIATAVSRQTFYDILSGKNKPSFDLLLKLKQVYEDFDINWFVSGMGDTSPPPIASEPYPLYGERRAKVKLIDDVAHAGSGGNNLDAYTIDTFSLPSLPIGDYIAIKVKGDSMAPTLATGDTIVLQQVFEVTTNQVYAFITNDGGSFVKRLRKRGTTVTATSDNATYQPMTFDWSSLHYIYKVCARLSLFLPPPPNSEIELRLNRIEQALRQQSLL